jgi:hypothetical protein
MDAGIGAKATVLDCMGGDGEGQARPGAMAKARHLPVLEGNCAWPGGDGGLGAMAKATAHRGSVTWHGAKTQAGSGRRHGCRHRTKAMVLDSGLGLLRRRWRRQRSSIQIAFPLCFRDACLAASSSLTLLSGVASHPKTLQPWYACEASISRSISFSTDGPEACCSRPRA